jgi:hypothetical protein
VTQQPLRHISIVSRSSNSLEHTELRCPICDHSVPRETAKTDESGRAFHETCYMLKMELTRATEHVSCDSVEGELGAMPIIEETLAADKLEASKQG